MYEAANAEAQDCAQFVTYRHAYAPARWAAARGESHDMPSFGILVNSLRSCSVNPSPATWFLTNLTMWSMYAAHGGEVWSAFHHA